VDFLVFDHFISSETPRVMGSSRITNAAKDEAKKENREYFCNQIFMMVSFVIISSTLLKSSSCNEPAKKYTDERANPEPG
jgi:hypothetical protein